MSCKCNTNNVTVLILILLITTMPVLAADYYVSVSGIDSNLGTIDQPWRTVQMAANRMVAGDTTYVRGGTYNEDMITFANSGTSTTNRITIKNYPGEMPVIDGGHTSVGGRTPVFFIASRNWITLQGLTITRGSYANIYIGYNGASNGITIDSCILTDFVTNDNGGSIYLEPNNDNIVIRNNNINGGVQGGYSNTLWSGIVIFRNRKLDILNNYIHGDLWVGIYYKHSNDDGYVTTVKNNSIDGTRNDAIRWSRSDGIISNNLITNSDKGVRLFEEAASCSSLVTARNLIVHNSLINNKVGILLDKSSSCPGAVNTVVKDNLIYGFTSGEYRGLSVWAYASPPDASNTTFYNNLIYSSSITPPIRVIATNYSIPNMPLTGTGNIVSAPIFRLSFDGDYTLTPDSPGVQAASDNTNIGANISIVGPTPKPKQAMLF